MAKPEHLPVVPLPSPVDPGHARRAELELHVGEMRQFFNSLDPAPFRERDLDPNAEEYIVDWGREAPAGVPLGAVVRLSREPVTPENDALLHDAVPCYFRQRAEATRRKLRRLFRVGRISLAIGLAFLAGTIVIGEFVAGLVGTTPYGGIIEESLVIGGWVALWRPLEIFLYDWWPIRAEAKLYDRLSAINVRVLDASPTTVTGMAR
jgi:hypothetical protein